VIIEENSYNKNLYQIKAGKVNVQKLIEGKQKVLATMEQPQMFGEMSILNNSTTNVAIVAESGILFDLLEIV
jgi:CRP-like cAMP-binding protein